jgi:hypothetical protein
LEDAYRKASEALRFHIKGMLADGESIPEPSSLTDILENPENAGATPFLVPIANVKTKRINITMPESDLEEIDAKDVAIIQTFGAVEERGLLIVISPPGGPVVLRIYEMFSDLVERYVAGRHVLYDFVATYVVAVAMRAQNRCSVGYINA